MICNNSTGTVATSSEYSIGRTVETMDYVVCSGSEYQLSDCDYDVHVTVIGNVPRTGCAYCKYIPVIRWFNCANSEKLSVQGQYV